VEASPSPSSKTPERSDPNYRDVLLEGRLRQALVRLDLPPEALDDAYRKLTRVDAPSLVEKNRAVHRMLVVDISVQNRRRNGSIAGVQARPALHYFGSCG
jgi:type I restriction enzyme R subunit